MKLRGRCLLLIALAVLPAAAQADSGFGRFHALVIGNQNYRHLTKLQTPLADAKEVAEVLKTQYGFTVDLLLDKRRDEIKLALSELRKTMIDERDNLLIYYAGHGYLDERTSTGYWQPVDAEKDNDVYWLPTDEISRLLKAVRARHVLIVADSCYSGSLLMRDSGARLPAAASRDEWLKRMQAKRSRTALTSGGEEPVADGGGSGHSVFAKALLEVLRENKEILDGDSLFDRIKRPVILNADQTPLYGDIKMTGHEMGDFLLVPKEMQEGGMQEKPAGKADLDFLKREFDKNALDQPKQSELFDRAMQFFKKKDFRAAYKLFEQSLSGKIGDKQAAKTLYMMGECLFNQGDYDISILDYQKVISDYSDDSYSAAALLRQGMAFEKLTDKVTAAIIYEKLNRKHPDSREAKAAKERLESLTTK
ncbi:caspase family protein [Candidatus Electronema sp. JC]|uniref:caspase family protein n=1 Tax=Candidatus Electronema sp. JC TaxID=3401570 RepID=UPI003AA8281C